MVVDDASTRGEKELAEFVAEFRKSENQLDVFNKPSGEGDRLEMNYAMHAQAGILSLTFLLFYFFCALLKSWAQFVEILSVNLVSLVFEGRAVAIPILSREAFEGRSDSCTLLSKPT